MTLKEIVANHLLPYIGVTSLDPDDSANVANQSGMGSNDVFMAAAAVTGALQEIFALGPRAISEQRRSAVLYPPTPVTFTATQFSNTISGMTGFQSWMTGCTIQPSGDGYDNEITSQTTLVQPYMGSSGTVQATVYCDSVLLRADEKNVMGPIDIPNVRQVYPVWSREDFRHLVYGQWRSADASPLILTTAYYNTRKTIGFPQRYLVEAAQDTTLSVLPIYIRLNPMPAQALPMRYRVQIKPPVVTAQQVQAGDDAPLAVIPVEWHESILVPFAKNRFMSHPAFKNPIAAAQIKEDYQTAKSTLETFKPSTPAVPARYR